MQTKSPISLAFGISGSIAASVAHHIHTGLLRAGVDEIVTVATKNAEPFIRNIEYYSDEHEWSYYKETNGVYHIDIRKQCDLLLIAPLSANTLGKIASGICDNLLTNIVRAWDMSKPIVLCPAMNTHMWDHPITKRQLDFCRELGYNVVSPVEKLLKCGDFGMGALAPDEVIIDTVMQLLKGK